MTNHTKVIIIEDNEDLLNGYKFMLSNMDKYLLVGAYTTCEQAFEQIQNLVPKIIIMDIDLPGMSGIEGTKIIKKMLPKCDILMNTVYEKSDLVFQALCAGATGYITKSSGHKEFLEALDEISAGGAPMSANIARLVVNSFQKKNSSPLSEREFEVLQALSDGKSYKTIALNSEISLDTVKFHIKNIYIKLEVNNKEDAIKIAKDNKWV
ncbi:MAG: DNA-binding response regulator [Bacteroidetes bacterium]|nr:MAG: DNA-binding response regulator [Bacteroidota bacterium]